MSHEIDELLREAAGGLPEPTDEATTRARAAASAAVARSPMANRLRRWPPRPARLALAVVGVCAVALGGAGVGRLVAPAGSADVSSLPTAAPALEPAAGWTVATQGIVAPPGVRALVAANVPLGELAAPLELVPQAVLATLPEDGVVIVAAARTAAEPEPVAEADLARATSGLRLDEAQPATLWQGPAGGERALTEYVLGTTAGDLELDVHVYFGAPDPSPRLLAEAQAQLDRLSVRAAADKVTLVVRPTLARYAGDIEVSGAIAGGAGERVMLEINECHSPSWRAHGVATSGAGGSWFDTTRVFVNARLRARWGNEVSGEMAVRTRPGVSLKMLGGNRVFVYVNALVPFWRKPVTLERFDPRTKRWVAVKRGLLTETDGTGDFVYSGGRFSAPLVRDTLYRAVIANAATGPCYLAGYSNMVRR
jgi:hypothetical protein